MNEISPLEIPPEMRATTAEQAFFTEGLYRDEDQNDADWQNAKYRFLLIRAFHNAEGAEAQVAGATKQSRLIGMAGAARRPYYYDKLQSHLADVSWDLHYGPRASYGEWPVENREEFAYVGAGRLPIVKAACESGKYNAIILLGGGEPGSFESREIGRRYRIPVVSCAFSQIYIATMLGNKFSVIDVAEQHNMYYYDLIVRHRLEKRCASILNVNMPHWRPGSPPIENELYSVYDEFLKTGKSDALEAVVEAAIDAIENDGAEVITFGCSAAFWMKWPVEQRLAEIGWDVPVLEGYGAAISVAKLMVDLGVDASGLTFPCDHPKKWRRKKVF